MPKEKVNQKKLDKILNYLIENKDCSNIYVSSCMDIQDREGIVDDIKYEVIEAKREANFRLCASPGFWRKDRLIKFTKDTDSPWMWEIFGTIRIYKYKDKVLKLDENCSYPYKVIFPSGIIIKGKWNVLYYEEAKNKYPDFNFNERGTINICQANHSLSLKEKISFLFNGFIACGFSFVYYFKTYFQSITKNESK